MVFCCFAVPYKTGTGLADPHSRPGQVLSEPLIMFEQPTELELGHGLAASCAGAHRGRSGLTVAVFTIQAGLL